MAALQQRWHDVVEMSGRGRDAPRTFEVDRIIRIERLRRRGKQQPPFRRRLYDGNVRRRDARHETWVHVGKPRDMEPAFLCLERLKCTWLRAAVEWLPASDGREHDGPKKRIGQNGKVRPLAYGRGKMKRVQITEPVVASHVAQEIEVLRLLPGVRADRETVRRMDFPSKSSGSRLSATIATKLGRAEVKGIGARLVVANQSTR